jgi:hypothetical protein
VVVAVGLALARMTHNLRQEVKAEVAELRTDLRADIAELRADLREVRSEIGEVRSDLTRVALAVGAQPRAGHQ